MLHVNELVYRVGARTLLDGATLAVSRGWRLGLIGRNGTGKTTLLRLIAGELHPDGGEIRVPALWRVGRVAQEVPGGPRSLIETVLAADEERTRLLDEAETSADPQRLAEIHERLASIRADSAPARAARILAGLGFDEAGQQRPCGDFSGGWRMRVALAALLFAEPDLLLLDEPTNHLDLEAALWLESFLRSYPGTLILVSHDRDLLNRVVNRVAHLEGCRLTLYSGNYDRFERTRRERLERVAASNARIQAQRRHIQAFVDRFRYKASKARQAQSRLKMLERLQPIVSVAEAQTLTLEFPAPKALSPPILTLDSAGVGYAPDRPVLARLDLRIDMDDRIALLGANGNGKSTLARLFAGRLKPLVGRLTRSPKLKVGYFSQDQADELDYAASPLDHLERLAPLDTEQRRRSQLGRFGFSAEHAEVSVGRLSGGEKARLLLALATREAPQLLILDEPTNHLDIDTREALVQALNAFEGAVVLITHDVHLVETVADRLWLVQDGGVRAFEGDMADYRALLLGQRREEHRQARDDGPKVAAAPTAKARRRASAEARAAVAHLKRAAREAETRLERLSAEKDRLEAQLADPGTYEAPTEEVTGLQRRHNELLAAIAAAEGAWLEAQEGIEAAAAD